MDISIETNEDMVTFSGVRLVIKGLVHLLVLPRIFCWMQSVYQLSVIFYPSLLSLRRILWEWQIRIIRAYPSSAGVIASTLLYV